MMATLHTSLSVKHSIIFMDALKELRVVLFNSFSKMLIFLSSITRARSRPASPLDLRSTPHTHTSLFLKCHYLPGAVSKHATHTLSSHPSPYWRACDIAHPSCPPPHPSRKLVPLPLRCILSAHLSLPDPLLPLSMISTSSFLTRTYTASSEHPTLPLITLHPLTRTTPFFQIS